MPRPLAGQVQTVLGVIAPETMGVTLPHEHLLIDFKVMFSEPAPPSDKGRAWEPVSLANLGYHHLLVNVVPRLRMKGVDDAGLRRLLVDNPAHAFTFG